MGENGELWKVKRVILGGIVGELWGIVGEYGRKGGMKKNFVV